MPNENTVVFTYNIGQDVRIVALMLPGRVMARCDRGHGLHEYRVVYWANSERCDVWLYDYELEPVKAKV